MVTNIAAQAQADLQPVYLHGPWQCQPSVCMGMGSLISDLFTWPVQTQAGCVPTCPMDLDQAQAQAGKATYMPLALLLALQPRQQQLIRCPRT